MMDTMDYKELYSLTLSLYSLTTAMLEFKVSSDHTVQFPTGQKYIQPAVLSIKPYQPVIDDAQLTVS